jgi:membrane fusion protein
MASPSMSDRTSAPSYLPREPPYWAVSRVAYLLIMLFVAAAAAAVVVRVPEVVTAQFALVPTRGVDPVKAPRRGTVTEVRVREGDAVGADQPIAVIGSEELGDRWSELQMLETQLRGAEAALLNVRDQRANQRQAEREQERALRDRVAVLDKMTGLREEQITLSREFVERRRRLFEEGLTNREEITRAYLEAQEQTLRLAELEADRSAAQRALAGLLHEIEARDAAFREQERQLNERIDTSRIRAGQLRAERVGRQRADAEVSAPCAGVVLRLALRAPRAVVQEGELIAEVACAGERLQAELTMPQSGVARVREGTPVRLLYDAFPYQQFGVRYGSVRWVSPATALSEPHGGFRVLVDLADTVFTVDGESRRPMPGMTGTARLVVGQRSLLEYGLGPLRELRERFAEPARDRAPAAGHRGT